MNYNGNLAYEYKKNEDKTTATEIRKLKKKPKAQQKNSVIIAKSVVYLVVALVLLSMLIYTQMTQVEVSQKLAETKSQLNQIKSENEILKVKLETDLSNKNIEAQANQYGLVKPDSSQYEYITTKAQSKAELIKAPSFFENAKSWVANLFSK